VSDRDIVIIAGSGRSGTTWLGSILDTYDKCDYFYEIDAYPELHFDDNNLLRIKYPLTHWTGTPPVLIQEIEHKLLLSLQRLKIGSLSIDKTLRIRNRFLPKAAKKEVNLFKIVRLFSFAMECEKLALRLGKRLKIVHILRNPFAQLISQYTMISKKNRVPARPFKRAFDVILTDPRLSQYRHLANQYSDGSWMERAALVWWVSNEVLINSQGTSMTTVLFEDLVRHPHEETERIFRFLGWPMSKRTHDHIAETTNPNTADNETHSIRKSADAVLSKWKKRISEKDYDAVSHVLEHCQLMERWDQDELHLHHPSVE